MDKIFKEKKRETILPGTEGFSRKGETPGQIETTGHLTYCVTRVLIGESSETTLSGKILG